MKETQVAAICKAMGDANRLQIIKMLYKEDKCGNDILEELDITQPTLSHHMKILCGSGLVRSEKKGKCTCYFLCCKVMHEFQDFISRIDCPSYGTGACKCVSIDCNGT